jgi:MFS family permease
MTPITSQETSVSVAYPQTQRPKGAARKVAAASLAGNTIEYYDFSIYGLAAALVFPALFFPNTNPFIGTLATFATLAVGYFSRPVGAVIFGHFGDRIGRKSILVITLLIMGGVTTLIGLLPTYETIGIWAAIILVLLRLAQGVAFGGEWGGAILMAFEFAPANRRGFYAAIPQLGPAAGSILGNAAFLLVTLLPKEQMMDWGWRIPFLFSAVLVAVGLFIRLRLAESPEFQTVKQEGQEVKVPLLEVLRNHLKSVVLVALSHLGFGAFSILVIVYLVNFSTKEAGVNPTVMLTITLITFVVQIPMILLAGHLSDIMSRRKMMVIGSVLVILAVFHLFWAVGTHNPWLIAASYIFGFGCCYSLVYGAQAALFADSFPAEVRFTGMSLGYQIATSLGSGLTPMVAAILLQYTGNPYAISIFVTALLFIAMISMTRLIAVADLNRRKASGTLSDSDHPAGVPAHT